MATGYEIVDTWKARDRGFQMAIIQHVGQTLHFTGQVAWDADENIVGVCDVEAQTRQCFENIGKLLREVGGTFEDIVSITTYFTDRAQLPAIQKVRTEYFTAGTAPASTSVMIAGLGHEDFLVELTPVAVVPLNRFKMPKP